MREAGQQARLLNKAVQPGLEGFAEALAAQPDAEIVVAFRQRGRHVLLDGDGAFQLVIVGAVDDTEAAFADRFLVPDIVMTLCVQRAAASAAVALCLKLTNEFVVLQRDMQLAIALVVGAAGQQGVADLRQQSVGQDGVDHAAAGLHLGAAADDLLDDRVVEGADDVVILRQATLDAAQLQAHDVAQRSVGQRVIRHHQQAAEQGGREH